jgi:hypothetical protein
VLVGISVGALVAGLVLIRPEEVAEAEEVYAG